MRIESPPRVEFGAVRVVVVRFRGGVDETEGGVVIGGESGE